MPQTSGVPTVIAQTDGTMIPTVVMTEIDEDGQRIDKRKTRQTQWREARLSLARPKGSKEVTYAANFRDVEETGRQLLDCAIEAGAGSQTRVHCVSDGAGWIATQVEAQFGDQATHLIDFYHLCEYLEAAEKSLEGDFTLWLERQKQRMKENQIRDVLNSLNLLKEPAEIPDDQAPVRACHRYINNRPGRFNYKDAIAEELPIGSGEIESGNRHVIQSRLKRPGAWWAEENVQPMLSLRTLRANGGWKDYWRALSAA